MAKVSSPLCNILYTILYKYNNMYILAEGIVCVEWILYFYSLSNIHGLN